jgi:hypothetical protein
MAAGARALSACGRALGIAAAAGWQKCLCRIDLSADDPGVLAHLPAAAESVLLEELHCGTEQETTRSIAIGGYLRDGDQAAGSGLGPCHASGVLAHPQWHRHERVDVIGQADTVISISYVGAHFLVAHQYR